MPEKFWKWFFFFYWLITVFLMIDFFSSHKWKKSLLQWRWTGAFYESGCNLQGNFFLDKWFSLCLFQGQICQEVFQLYPCKLSLICQFLCEAEFISDFSHVLDSQERLWEIQKFNCTVFTCVTYHCKQLTFQMVNILPDSNEMKCSAFVFMAVLFCLTFAFVIWIKHVGIIWLMFKKIFEYLV